MVELDKITKHYGALCALDQVSLTVIPGSTVVLVGPSGCGKSTLLRVVAGLVQPDHGQVRVGNIVMSRSTCGRIRDRLGYVIQDGGLFPHLTARDNVSIRARQMHWGAKRMNERIQELADLTHLPSDALDRRPPQLSGGQRQRLGIMRALMTDPDVLLFDEPLGALDPIIRRDLQDDLKEIFARLSKTVILVTHDLHEADWFADDIVLMKDGRIEQKGSAEDLADRPATEFVSRFVRAQRTSDFGCVAQ